MIRLASIIDSFESAFLAQYRERFRPEHTRALAAIKLCRTQASPKILHLVLKFDPGPITQWIKQRAPIVCACCGAVMRIVRTRIRPTEPTRATTPIPTEGTR